MKYLYLVMHSLNELTEMGAIPQIVFDSQKDSRADNIIHKWAQDEFNHGSGTLLYSF